MRGYLEKNSMLVKEFDHYILEHPEFTDDIPDAALVVMQLAGARNSIVGQGRQQGSRRKGDRR